MPNSVLSPSWFDVTAPNFGADSAVFLNAHNYAFDEYRAMLVGLCKNGLEYVLKVIPIRKASYSTCLDTSDCIIEGQIMSFLMTKEMNHPNIPYLYRQGNLPVDAPVLRMLPLRTYQRMILPRCQYYLVPKYDSDLCQAIKQKRSKLPYTEIMFQVLLFLKQCQQWKLMHRDLHLKNVLIQPQVHKLMFQYKDNLYLTKGLNQFSYRAIIWDWDVAELHYTGSSSDPPLHITSRRFAYFNIPPSYNPYYDAHFFLYDLYNYQPAKFIPLEIRQFVERHYPAAYLDVEKEPMSPLDERLGDNTFTEPTSSSSGGTSVDIPSLYYTEEPPNDTYNTLPPLPKHKPICNGRLISMIDHAPYLPSLENLLDDPLFDALKITVSHHYDQYHHVDDQCMKSTVSRQ